MKEWIPKKKTVRLSFAAASFCVLLYFLALFLVLGGIKRVADFYNDNESALNKNEKALTLKSLAETNKDSIRNLRGFFVQKGDEIEFINKIESAARSSNLKFEISSIEVKQDKTNPWKENIEIKMDLEGSWNNIFNFAGKLERMPFGVSLEGLSANTRSGGWAGSVNFTVFREK